MKREIKEKIREIYETNLPLWEAHARRLGTAEKAKNDDVVSSDLQAIFGGPAVKRAQRRLEVLDARVCLAEAITSGPTTEKIAKALAKLTNPESYKQRLSTLFPGLKAAEIRELKENLAAANCTFKGSTITGFKQQQQQRANA